MQQTELQLINTISSHDNYQPTTAAAGSFSWSRKAVPKVHKVWHLYLNVSKAARNSPSAAEITRVKL